MTHGPDRAPRRIDGARHSRRSRLARQALIVPRLLLTGLRWAAFVGLTALEGALRILLRLLRLLRGGRRR